MGCTQGGKAVSPPGGNSRSDAQRSQYSGARKDASAWRTSWRLAAARKAARGICQARFEAFGCAGHGGAILRATGL